LRLIYSFFFFFFFFFKNIYSKNDAPRGGGSQVLGPPSPLIFLPSCLQTLLSGLRQKHLAQVCLCF
jgi:hypothetical protein